MRLMQTALVVAMLQHRMHPDEGQVSVELAPSFANVYVYRREYEPEPLLEGHYSWSR